MDKPYVLLADDNEGTCTLITALLRPHFEVHVARDGQEAVEKLKARRYEALILDLLMPVADGYTTLDFVRDDRPAFLSKVLVVTASILPAQMSRLEPYQVAGVISKPFEIDALLGAVRQIVDEGAPPLRASLLSSGVLLILADLLRQRLL